MQEDNQCGANKITNDLQSVTTENLQENNLALKWAFVL